ncbi:MAG: NAD(P)H-dependent oxidoreductase [Butyrivibrio sp.]|nr:NAD(P)H-dependent oxidoreductase [Butyrivibrio sp.]MBR1640832.1 NAD(P)H-dependent oxidoreductase [Butyrivibrio sp.]
MILFVDACVRDDSRTKRLASEVLSRLKGEVKTVKLKDVKFEVTNQDYLRRRDELIAKREFDSEMFAIARDFKEADQIVIAAPYWDLSFPAMLKQYIEHINVLGITFEYTKEGTPVGLCKADRLYYVMTAGGAFVPEEYGFGYVKVLAQSFYGIDNVKLIKAVGLDIYGADVDQIMDEAIRGIDL